MKLGRILYPIKALGPGDRLGIWLQGCNRNCEGCANPDLQDMNKPDVPIEMVVGMAKAAIKNYDLCGVSITGGEPILQAKELVILLNQILPICDDILLFTGFTIDELRNSKNPDIEALLSRVSVIVDGPYIRSRNKGELLRGSDNQNIIYINELIQKKYEQYLALDQRIIDSFFADDKVITVGIHRNELLRNTIREMYY